MAFLWMPVLLLHSWMLNVASYLLVQKSKLMVFLYYFALDGFFGLHWPFLALDACALVARLSKGVS